jgi:hypothetical protein
VVGASAKRQRLIRWVRRYPIIASLVLATAYLLGAFSQSGDGLLPKAVVITALYLFVGLVPLGFIIAFIWVGRLGDIEKEKGRTSNTFGYADPFDLPSQVMHGYKLALITDRKPTLTGLTGDRYLADAAAKCSVNKEHIPPAADCECGFYAYKELADAQFELSINPGAFLLDVDLFGIGFTYQGGYRAESQVVNYLSIPKRCMRCRILPVKVFVTSYKLGFEDSSWWQWQIRCGLCSASFKDSDRLSIAQMAERLSVAII